MLQTLFHIPHEWNGIPVFGWGWALGLWLIVSAVVLSSAARASSLEKAVREWSVFLLFMSVVIVFVLPLVELKRFAPDGTVVADGIAIRGYGVMMGLAILSAVVLAAYRAYQRGISADVILGMATWLVILGIAGGRVFFLIQYWEEFKQANLLATVGEMLNLTKGGLVVYGAFLGGFLGFCIYVFRNRMSFLASADLVVPSLMLGLAIGRIGCFCNGCCYGGPTDSRFGVRFPPESVPYVEHLRTGRFHGFRLNPDSAGRMVVVKIKNHSPAAKAALREGTVVTGVNGIPFDSQAARDQLRVPEGQSVDESVIAQLLIESSPRSLRLDTDQGPYSLSVSPLPARTEPIHPTQLYSAITAGLICLFLLAVEPFLSKSGMLLAIWITVYPLARFLLELIRIDEGSFAGTGLTIAQNVSIVIGIVAACLWFYLWRHGKQAERYGTATAAL